MASPVTDDGPAIHICAPSGVDYRMIMKCHDCGHRGRHAVTVYLWYGLHVACCNCGRESSDGVWLPREFSPTGREKAIAAAKRRWADAPPRSEADRAFRALVESVTS